jgi:hypothetical protein
MNPRSCLEREPRKRSVCSEDAHCKCPHRDANSSRATKAENQQALRHRAGTGWRQEPPPRKSAFVVFGVAGSCGVQIRPNDQLRDAGPQAEEWNRDDPPAFPAASGSGLWSRLRNLHSMTVWICNHRSASPLRVRSRNQNGRRIVRQCSDHRID